MTKRRLSMPVAAMAIAMVVTSGACRSREGTLVEVSVDATTTLPDVAKLAVTATIGAETRQFEVPLANKSIPPKHVFAIEVPGNRSGTINVAIDARSSGDVSVGTKSGSVAFSAGSVVALSLVIGSPDVDMAGGSELDGGGSDDAGADGGSDMPTGPVITPSAPTLGAGRYIQLNADSAVTWAVVGGDTNGTISATGLYNAPFTPGTYTVTATGSSGASEVPVIVKPLAMRLLGGKLGGPGNADGVGPAVRFGSMVSMAGEPPEVYVADGDNQIVRRLNTTLGSVVTLFGQAGVAGGTDGVGVTARFDSPYAIFKDSDLFLMDNNTRVRRINRTSLDVTTVAASGGRTGPSDALGMLAVVSGELRRYQFADPTQSTLLLGGFGAPRGVAFNLSTIYVAEQNIIKAVSSSGSVWTAVTIAGDGTAAGTNAATGTSASFRAIVDIAVVDSSWLLVVDGECTIRRVSLSSPFAVTTLAGDAADCRYLDGPASIARFLHAEKILGTDNGFAIVADGGEGGAGLRKIDANTGAVESLAGRPLMPVGFGVDGAAADAVWTPCYALAVDGNRLVLPCPGNGKPTSNSIRTLQLSDGNVGTLAGHAELFGPDDGIGADARFKAPMGIALIGTDAFVADVFNYSIRRVALSNGATTTLAGSASESGATDGVGDAARFSRPFAVAACTDKLLVLDGTGLVRGVDPSTRAVTTVAGDSAEVGSQNGIGTAARFDFNPPTTAYPLIPGIACDPNGFAYVADLNNATIRRIELATKSVTTLAGVAGQRGSVDGIGDVARFRAPTGLAHDQHRTLYVSDGTTVRAVDTATGEVRTVIGKDGRNGVATGTLPAGLNGPAGIGVGPDGNLYVTDQIENSILVVESQ